MADALRCMLVEQHAELLTQICEAMIGADFLAGETRPVAVMADAKDQNVQADRNFKRPSGPRLPTQPARNRPNVASKLRSRVAGLENLAARMYWCSFWIDFISDWQSLLYGH